MFSVDKLITEQLLRIYILLFFFSQNELVGIYQRPQINAITPDDQF